MKAVGLVAVMLLVSGLSLGQDDKEIVVSATKLETDKASVASTVTVVYEKDIERRQDTTIVDLLKDVPGVHVSQNGGQGTTVNVMIRGAKSEQVLVLVDGVEMNDPIAPGRGAYIGNIGLENVERVEVLRGSQSALYGSDAIAGVISITTKKGEGEPSAYASVDAGSFSTFKERVGVSGSSGKMNYSLSIARIDSEGISAADENDGNSEEDGFEYRSASARFGIDPCDNLELGLILRYISSESEFDASGGEGGDAEDNLSTRDSLFLRAQGSLDLFDSLWRHEFGVSVASHDRTSESEWGKSTFDSRLFKADWQNNVYINDNNVLVTGLEYEQEEGKTDSLSRKSVDTISAFVQDQAELNGSLNVVLGARLDSHEEFGEELTYRVGPVYNIETTGTRLKATYGTGFKAPSIYQLYAPAGAYGPIGNEDLDPEKSTGWDLGVEQAILEDLTAEVSYFSTDFEDMIEYEAGYVNKSKAEVRGVELYTMYRANEMLSCSLGYTYLETEDKDTGEDLIRRPDHRVSVGVDYTHGDKAHLGVTLLYVGERSDRYYNASMFTNMDAELSDYTVVNVVGSYNINDNIRVFGRIENIFDVEYQEVTGYGTPDMSAYGGVKISL